MLKFESTIAYKRIGWKKSFIIHKSTINCLVKKNFFNIKLRNLPFWKVNIVIKLPKVICLMEK